MKNDTAVNGGRRGKLLFVLVAAVSGLAVLLLAFASQQPAPPELASPVGEIDPAASPSPSPRPSRPPAPAQSTPGVPEVEPAADVPLGPSEPVSISIPAIDVRSDVFPIGKASDGSLAVPQPGPNLDKAAWYESSPTPGQPGPSVIEGHVATLQNGPSVFLALADLRPGDRIEVERADGTTVVFEVDALREFAKDRFPTRLVYAGDLATPQLRLITCSSFDPSVGQHTGNVVVFSHLARVRRG